MHRVLLLPPIAALALSLACGGGEKSPTAPSPPVANTSTTTTTTVPTIQRITVFGIVRNSDTNAPVGGATVRATNANTANAGSTTDGNGYYSIPGVAAGAVTLEFTAPRFNAFTARPSFDRDSQFDQRLTPFWARSGVGNTVFDMPTHVQRVRITGRYTSSSSNFIVRIGGRLVVNELLGTFWGGTTYDGLHLTSGGVVEITNSRDVQWTFSQEQ